MFSFMAVYDKGSLCLDTMMLIVFFLTIHWLGFAASVTPSVAYRTQDGNCPSNCSCIDKQIKCEGWIPKSVPRNTKEVILLNLQEKDLFPGIFCQCDWNDVRKLEINSDKTDLLDIDDKSDLQDIDDKSELKYIKDDFFKCLDQLTKFKLHFRSLMGFSKHAFSGLSNVTMFDLSESQNLYWSDLFIMLAEQSNLPNLTHLNLSLTGFGQSFVLSQSTINILGLRPLRYLDLSFLSVSFTITNPGELCDTLTTFVLQGATITRKATREPVCKSLRILDFSENPELVQKFTNFVCKDKVYYLSFHGAFFDAVQSIYINQIMSLHDNDSVTNCALAFYLGSNVTEVHFSKHHLPQFNLGLLNDRLQYIDLSYNKIEIIGPNVFRKVTSLSRLDLSHNSLFKMLSSEAKVSTLLSNNQQLKCIDLSSNGLSYLPEDLFNSNTQLEELHLMGNSFHQIAFNISDLFGLSLLDLRFNSIQNLDFSSRNLLDSLLRTKRQRRMFNNNATMIHVLLEGNPFSCNCDSLDFLKWFATSPLFITSRHLYYCQLHGQKAIMTNGTAIGVAENECKRLRRKQEMIWMAIILTIFVSLVILVLMIYYRRRRAILLKKKFDDRVRLLRENNLNFPFPVFLSYASADKDFVDRNIRQQLQQNLQAMIDIDQELICDADRHFIPGHSVFKEMRRCVEEAAVFIAVMSEKYCSSAFCQFEITEARTTGKPIILLFKEHVNDNKMSVVVKEVFRQFARAQFVFQDGHYKIQPAWPQLCKSIVELM